MERSAGPAIDQAFAAALVAVIAISASGVKWLFAAEGKDQSVAEPAVADPDGASVEFFEKQVRPILSARCFQCHGPVKQASDLRLDSRAAAFEGGVSGPAI